MKVIIAEKVDKAEESVVMMEHEHVDDWEYDEVMDAVMLHYKEESDNNLSIHPMKNIQAIFFKDEIIKVDV